jgi:four helix bundle protein
MLYLSEKLNYLEKAKVDELIIQTNEVSKMLYAFIKSMK